VGTLAEDSGLVAKSEEAPIPLAFWYIPTMV